jgi:divalent metal cation (Fe/Co/Zn/Cd) transporter
VLVTKCSMQELLDKGLPRSMLEPIHKTVLQVDGVEVLISKLEFIQLKANHFLKTVS